MPFYQTDDPTMLQNEQGQMVPADSVDPSQIVGSAPASATSAPPPPAPDMSPAPPPAAAPLPAAPGARPSTPAGIVGQLDHPALAGLQLSGESVTSGVDTSKIRAQNSADSNQIRSDIKVNAQNEIDRKTKSVAMEQEQAKARSDAANQDAIANHAAYVAAKKNELALRDQSDPAVDPDQFMRDNGLGTILLAALAGAMGGATGHGQEATQLAMNTIDKRIDQNIAAQKSQIESGRIRRGNLIDYYQKQGFDAKESEAAAKAMYYSQVDRFTQLEVQRNEIPGIADTAKLLSDQVKKQTDDQNGQLQLAGASRVTKTYARPVGNTFDKVWDNIKAAHNIQEFTDTGHTPEENDKIRTETKELGSKLQPTLDMANGIDQIINAGGGSLSRDKSGKIVATGDIPGIGFVDSKQIGAGLGMNQQGVAMEGAVKNATDVLARMRSGGAISESEEKTYRNMLGNTSNENTFLTNLNNIDRFVRARAADVSSGFSTEAVQAFGKNRGSLASAPSGVTPVRGLIQ